jgi:aryl-alcohol dehydrogenase-like predicted oxidoreductase
MLTRKLGRSGIEVSAIGMGCWAIGGVHWRDGEPIGWGKVNDEDSLSAIDKALELGATFFDTADAYGCGHSEELLGGALAGKRDKVVIATKVGHMYDEEKRISPGQCGDPDYIHRCCDESLRRLATDYIDLYQFHLGGYELDVAPAVRDVMEELVEAGKIRYYGWSTDSPERARLFAEGPNCTAIQQRLNVFVGNEETLSVCEENDLASINRGPLAMGLLTGKYNADSVMPDDDIRRAWDLKEGSQAKTLAKLEDMRDALTGGGRTLAQGALCWLLARSEKTIPIPGFKTADQVAENIAAADFGPLSDDAMRQIDEILSR